MNAPDPIKLRGTIGDILVARGHLTEADTHRIVARQRTQHEPFGVAAVALKLVTQKDLDAALSTQFSYDYLPEDDTSLSREVVTAYKPFSRSSEEMRALRSQLMLRWFNNDAGRSVLSIVSQRTKDGRSYIAANLAVVFAQQGQRTLLIDGDLRNPRQSELFRTPNSAGLAGILSGRVGTEVITPVSGLPGLSILPAGAPPPNPQELVGMPRFGELIQQAVRDHDVVLIDTPASDAYADAEIISARAGAALLVARKHKSLLRDTTILARNLQDSGVALVGSALNHY